MPGVANELTTIPGKAGRSRFEALKSASFICHEGSRYTLQNATTTGIAPLQETMLQPSIRSFGRAHTNSKANCICGMQRPAIIQRLCYHTQTARIPIMPALVRGHLADQFVNVVVGLTTRPPRSCNRE